MLEGRIKRIIHEPKNRVPPRLLTHTTCEKIDKCCIQSLYTLGFTTFLTHPWLILPTCFCRNGSARSKRVKRALVRQDKEYQAHSGKALCANALGAMQRLFMGYGAQCKIRKQLQYKPLGAMQRVIFAEIKERCYPKNHNET